MKGLFQYTNFRRPNEIQTIAGGFLLLVFFGAFLLTLPISSRDGQWTNFLNCLLTSTSATCVTGLIAFDTFTHWSIFGQIIILLMIQIGGLGFITIGVMFSMLFRRRIGLGQRSLMKESVNAMEIGGIVKLTRKILFGTLFFEGAGAILLSVRFIRDFGFLRGIYYGIFHSISAFCNAGFDLMGISGEYSSFTTYWNDPYVIIILSCLIIIGSLGFVVWDEISIKKFHFKQYSLHTKLVLSVNLILIVCGTALMFLVERNNTIAGMNFGDGLLASFFGAVTPRTAGFNSIDTGSLTNAGKFVTILLMFIGGSPGSTAGGIKTTTIAVMVIYLISNLRGSSGANVFKRRIGDDIIKKACMVFFMNLFLSLIAILIILATNHLAFVDTVFEVISAISTVGMTAGITRELNTVGRIVIIILMYMGRVGSVTFALSLVQRPAAQKIQYPQEKVSIG